MSYISEIAFWSSLFWNLTDSRTSHGPTSQGTPGHLGKWESLSGHASVTGLRGPPVTPRPWFIGAPFLALSQWLGPQK